MRNTPPSDNTVPQDVYRWTLFDTPDVEDQRLRAVYKHDNGPWLAISPSGNSTTHHAFIFTESGDPAEKDEMDAQCLLNMLTTDNAVLEGCRVFLQPDMVGEEGDAYEHAGLD